MVIARLDDPTGSDPANIAGTIPDDTTAGSHPDDGQ